MSTNPTANDTTVTPAASPPAAFPHEPPHSEPQPHPHPSGEPKAAKSWPRKLLTVLNYTPPHCRYDPSRPPKFSLPLNILFAFAGCFTVANLYYNNPILHILARDFDVPFVKVAQIPTVMQAGYAAGLLFLCPLGDLLPRRPFVLGLVGFTTIMWAGLCVTKSLPAFTGLSFLVGMTTITPQLMLPLVGDLAPPKRRASALAIVVSGMVLGILIARVLSGIVTHFVYWRNVYWMALGLQTFIFIMLWLFLPDYPSTNPLGLNYFKMLWSIVVMVFKHPILVQSCISGFFTTSTFTSFWTTLSFLLSGSPYHYEPLAIGLFGLVGLATIVLVPVWARLVTDRFVPQMTVLVGGVICLLGICLGTYLGEFTIAGPILQALLLDFGMNTEQTANRTMIYAIEPKARNRVNTAFMVSVFCGQLTGTAVGNHIYARYGWVGRGSSSVGFIIAAILPFLVRGPWEPRWLGWRGGWSMIKKNKDSADGKTAEVPLYGVGDGKKDEELGVLDSTIDEIATEKGGARSGPLKDGSGVEEKDRGSEKSETSGGDKIVAVK